MRSDGTFLSSSNRRLKLTGAAVLVFRASTSLQAAPSLVAAFGHRLVEPAEFSLGGDCL